MSELAVLQAVRLKGRVSRDDLSSDLVDGLVASGLLVDGAMVRLTPEGRSRLAELLAAERSGIDPSAITAAYDEFRLLNTEFKSLVTDWQLRDGAPNTHEDPSYDAAVLARPLIDSYHTVWFELHEELILAAGLTREADDA